MKKFIYSARYLNGKKVKGTFIAETEEDMKKGLAKNNLFLEKSKQLLLNTTDPIYVISENIGMANHTYFCKLFKKKTGMTPNEFRNTR